MQRDQLRADGERKRLNTTVAGLAPTTSLRHGKTAVKVNAALPWSGTKIATHVNNRPNRTFSR